mmetsp:Transcript_62990/g.117136  ORF Transcript_62990/g.117136 Transcript_62990/m.117136 type:complete len:407 (+) Transcript_62990:62-1282(+)
MEVAAPPSISFGGSSKRTPQETEKVCSQRVPLDELLNKDPNFKAAFGLEAQRPFKGESKGKPAPVAKPEMLQSSAAQEGTETVGAHWGLCSTIVDAYNTHHELVLKPDDVWQAIVTQFSFYVNANGEALRDRFVDFQGKKTLVVKAAGTLFTADFGRVASRMVDEQIAKNIKDPGLAQWLIPDFSTTKENDRIVAAVTIMATLQAYFQYVTRLECGIPRVTLLGTVADWQQLRSKIDRLLEFDLQDELMTKWHQLLSPVLDELVRSAEGQPDVSFWDRIVSEEQLPGFGCAPGRSVLSGWVTVFAVFSDKGQWRGHLWNGPWPTIGFDDLPESAVTVPVLVDDEGVQYDTYMLAGQVAQEVLESGDALRPRSDWCIAYNGMPKTKSEEYRQGEVLPTGASRAENDL